MCLQVLFFSLFFFSIQLKLKFIITDFKAVIQDRMHMLVKQDVSCDLKEYEKTPQKLLKLRPRSHPRHLVGKRTTQKDAIKDTTSDSQVNSCFPYRWPPASVTFNICFHLFFIFTCVYNKNNDK